MPRACSALSRPREKFKVCPVKLHGLVDRAESSGEIAGLAQHKGELNLRLGRLFICACRPRQSRKASVQSAAAAT